MGKLKLNNDLIDLRLKNQNRNIKRLDNFEKVHNNIEWQCLIIECGFIWSASVSNILYYSGCPSCADTKYSNEIVDYKLKNRPIKRLDDYINMQTGIKWQCLNAECNNIWTTLPSSILNGESECPLCYRTNEKIVFNFLKKFKIEFEYHKAIKNLNNNETLKYIVDFYLPQQRVIIEYNGQQHYEPVCFGGCAIEKAIKNFEKQQKRDEYIRFFCKNNNIKLIEIDGRKLVRSLLETYMMETVLPIIGVNS